MFNYHFYTLSCSHQLMWQFWQHQICTKVNPRCRHWPHCLSVDVLFPSGQTVHTGGKPHAVFQGGDARQCGSRADFPPTVRPEEEKTVGPTLWVSILCTFLALCIIWCRATYSQSSIRMSLKDKSGVYLYSSHCQQITRTIVAFICHNRLSSLLCGS